MKNGQNVFLDDTILTSQNLALVTDLTCGFTQEQARKLGYDMVNFSVNIISGGEEIAFPGGNDDNESFYAQLSDPNTTGARTGSAIGDFLEIFKKRLSEGKLVVYLGVTDSLSAGMHNAALTARDMIRSECPELNADNILIPLTHCIAGGLGLGLRIIRDWLDAEPRTLSLLLSKIEETGDRMAHIFTLFSYDFMKNSGRFASTKDRLKISVAKTFKIYPIMLSPRDGPLNPTWETVRGDKALLKRFVDIYAGTAQSPEDGWVEIDYSGVTDNKNTAYSRAEDLRKMLRERFPGIKIISGQTSPSVGCHVGPDEMSFFFITMDLSLRTNYID